MNEVTAAIIVLEGKILLTRRKKGQKLAGLWEFPGGKVEDGETAQICLERELQEELGIKAKAGRLLASSEYNYDHGSFNLLALEAEILSGNIQLRVHDKAEWVEVPHICNYRLAPADIPIALKIVELFGGKAKPM